MSGTLFEGIHYYIQSRGDDPDLLEDFRTNLDLNGAIGCDNPCDSHCQLIFVETPTGETKFIYNAHGKPGKYEKVSRSGDWDFDALCTHFSRRGTGVPDIHKERRKKVVGVGWIVECLSHDKLLIDNRYDLWEVIAEDSKPRDVPTGRPVIPGQNAPSTLSRPSCDNRPAHRGGLRSDPRSMRPIDLHINKTHSLAAQETTPTPTLLSSTPTPIDWAKMPPSPPLTAASTMSTAGMCSVSKFFSPFTQDPYSPRTFFVACQNQTEVEQSITTHGGMLDGQRDDATFIIVDADRPGDAFPQATWNLLGTLRRSQKPVSPLWIDECVRRGTIVDLDQYITRTSPIAPFIKRQPKEERPTDTETPYKRRQKPTDIEVPYKHASVTVAAGDRLTLERKRRLSQSEIHLADDLVRPTIRKAVDPRVRPQLSAERQASNSGISTRQVTSIPRSVPATHSPDISKQKRQFPRASVYDRPDATTLNPARSSLGMKDDTRVVATSSIDASPRGVSTGSHSGIPIKPPYSNAAARPGPSPPNDTEADRPNTPPLPPHRSTSSEGLTSHGSIQKSDHRLNANVHSTEPLSSAKLQVAPPWPRHLASVASSILRPIPDVSQPQISDDDDHVSELSSLSSSEVSDYAPSSDGENTPHTRLEGPGASSRTSTVPRSLRILSSVSQARLGELVDILDKWLDTRTTETCSKFLRTLDVKKPGYWWASHYYGMRHTIRSRLLARGHDAESLDERGIHDAPDKGRLYEATDLDALTRNGQYHPGMAGCERRLKKLITHLDKWLQDGFQGTASAAIGDLKVISPEVDWTRLYRHKALTIRTRLLAMGWLKVVLDEADILGKSDRVRP